MQLQFIISAAFSPDGKQIVFSISDRAIQLWDATRTLEQTFESSSHLVKSVTFSPDGKQVVSGSADKTIRMWNTTGASLQTLEDHSDTVTSAAFSPDGKLLLTLLVSKNWIVEDATKLIWLPSEYRAIRQATWNRSIALEHPSDRASVFEFTLGIKLINEN